MIETFAGNPSDRWRFFTDSVMGGVSTGQIVFDRDGDGSRARMTGRVRTANNGGFIQMQMRFDTPLPANCGGVRLVACGNDQRYFIHLRSVDARTPMEFYRAAFDVTAEWREIRLPFSQFSPSVAGLLALKAGTGIASMAVVAYGRDHDADISVREIGFDAAAGWQGPAPLSDEGRY